MKKKHSKREKGVSQNAMKTGPSAKSIYTNLNPVKKRLDIICAIAATAMIILHFVVVSSYFSPATSTLDSHGYYKQGRLLATTGKTHEIVESRAQFTGYTWRKNGDSGRYDNIWPVGFPALLAATRTVFGAEAVYWVNPIMATLALAAFFVFCRAMIGSVWALATLALFALNPVFNQHIYFNYSHIAVLFFLMLSLALITAGWQTKRNHLCLFAAGVCAGFIPSLRMIESLFGLALFLYVLFKSFGESGWMKRTIAFAVGAAAPLFMFCAWNQFTYGAFWKTGYSVFEYDYLGVFAIDYLKLYSLAYMEKFLGEGAGYALSLGALGIVWLCARRETWKEGALMAALVFPFTLLQMSYLFHPAPEMMRFFLPTFPFYALAGIWVLKELTAEKRSQSVAVVSTLIALSAAWGLPQAKYSLNTLKHRQNALAEIADMVNENVPYGSVVVADEIVAQHLDVLGYWKVADATLLIEDRQKLYGNMRYDEKIAAFERDIRKWAEPEGNIYWIGKEGFERRFIAHFSTSANFSMLAQRHIYKNQYLENSDYAIRTRNRTSPRVFPQLKRGCYNFDMGAPGRFELMFASLLDGSPIHLFELKHSSADY